MKREVTGQIQIGDKRYFIMTETRRYNEANPVVFNDTLRPEGEDRVFRYRNGQDYLFYDFTLADGGTYIDPVGSGSSEAYFSITSSTLDSVETPAGKFYDCIELFFDIPQYVDDEMFHIFAPGVGLIKRAAGEGPTVILNSHIF
ncbi:MAG: hypothetical protein ABIA75_09500 [Candidatus Neomarinimicrobiota bacterium]